MYRVMCVYDTWLKYLSWDRLRYWINLDGATLLKSCMTCIFSIFNVVVFHISLNVIAAVFWIAFIWHMIRRNTWIRQLKSTLRKNYFLRQYTLRLFLRYFVLISRWDVFIPYMQCFAITNKYGVILIYD